jgi:hypothetical protein
MQRFPTFSRRSSRRCETSTPARGRVSQVKEATVEWFFPFYWAAAVDPVACGLVFGPPCQFRLGRLVVAATTTGAALSGIGSASGADGGLSEGGRKTGATSRPLSVLRAGAGGTRMWHDRQGGHRHAL